MIGPKVLLIDIETAPTLAWVWGLHDQTISIQQIVEHPRIICFAAKWVGRSKIEFYSEYHHDRQTMLEQAARLLDEADVVVGWNSKAFDVKWLMGEFMVAGIDRPSPFAQVDLMLEVKRNARFVSNKLDYVSKRILDDRKLTHSGFQLWLDCMAGDERAWAKMKRYNRKDVALLEPLYEALAPYINHPVNAALFTDDDGTVRCPGCGSDSLERRGLTHTRALSYQRFRCRSCGKWSRGNRSVAGSYLRGTS